MKSYNFTAKDKINARSASVALKEVAGETVTATAMAVCEETDVETGEVATVAYIVTDIATYGTISPTVIAAVSDIVDYMTSENLNSVCVKVDKRKSNAGRDFLTLSLV